jgi:hypothetical protein
MLGIKWGLYVNLCIKGVTHMLQAVDAGLEEIIGDSSSLRVRDKSISNALVKCKCIVCSAEKSYRNIISENNFQAMEGDMTEKIR